MNIHWFLVLVVMLKGEHFGNGTVSNIGQQLHVT